MHCRIMCMQIPRSHIFALYCLWLSTCSPGDTTEKALNQLYLQERQRVGSANGCTSCVLITNSFFSIKALISGGPTTISIYLRAGWSLGPVQSRYTLEGEGGDQVCGRAATGLPVTDVSFANLPPHFVSGDSGLETAEWEAILPGYSTFYPMSFRFDTHSL